MRKLVITCDVCGKEHKTGDWAEEPKSIILVTHCTSQNPMSRVEPGFQLNRYERDDVCQSCMRKIAESIATTIEELGKTKDEKIT